MVKSPIPAIQVGQIPSSHCLNPYLLFSNVILPSEILHVFPVPPVLLQQIRATFYSYSCWLRPQPRWFNLFKPSHLCGKTTHPIPSISSGGFNLPLWKMMEWKSVGMMKFPIYGKIKNLPNHQPVIRHVNGLPLIHHLPSSSDMIFQRRLTWI